MICPILIAIEIIDEAKAIFDESPTKKQVVHRGPQQIREGGEIREAGSMELVAAIPKPNQHRLHELGPRIIMLREMTDSPRELVEAIDDLVVGMIRNRSLLRWKMTAPAQAIYSPDAMDRIREMMESP